MQYGEDVPPRRVKKVEDLHAQEVMLRGALIEEFRAVFNLASLFADALAVVVPDHPYIAVARFEGMLGRFEIKPKESDASSETSKGVPGPVQDLRGDDGVLSGREALVEDVQQVQGEASEASAISDATGSGTEIQVQDIE